MAAVASQVLNVYLRAVWVELKARSSRSRRAPGDPRGAVGGASAVALGIGSRSWRRRWSGTLSASASMTAPRASFYQGDVWPECFLHESELWRRQFDGEDPGPAHPFVEALRDAAPGEVERLVPSQGTLILLWLGEDEIIRGERERPGPPVRETSPGVYE